MEIERPTIKIEENKITGPKLNINPKYKELNSELIEKRFIEGADSSFKGTLEHNEHSLLTIQPLQLFNYLEKEYGKVKDFDFSRIDVKDLKRNILFKNPL